ncbi:hypothetical protein SELMODRAFT_411320 [Selaginella moellendorffii]|uniref:Galactose oxidase-like Early set domain-containing protein n=1 Tax=Selaginella moellendorffii TaxID=88036 RepID=D8RH97_SELML|nr:aldehyde oxidase GLOX [Selaginella moellendorffii]EFJ28737.1 hypothetical protein SELMODRAFT_411320 [Selaginella moellendorffii]|eukprot:XP_002970607.1 aldehyde oxidase GLOX [Selaginella moellendorffii]
MNNRRARTVLALLSCCFCLSLAQQPGRFNIVLQNAGISSMHTAVTHYGNVIFLDRTNIGPSAINLVGNCRDNPADMMTTHDCTAHSVIYDPSSNTVRPVFIYSDTWCSSGQFLPNGTLMQTGGSSDGGSIIRYFTPCSSGSWCNWMESSTNLQSSRWYASNQILPDGRIIVVGGRGVYNYEFQPTGGQFYLQFLKDTADFQDDNLYPYLHLLPSNLLYIFANRDSILLNYFTNTVVRKFPTIPGEPRNYPCSGSSVMLALDTANSYSKAEVLVCGGANQASFKNSDAQYGASQTCGRMEVTSNSPYWDMSYMPFRRNMGDMVLLPTAKVLIINGAQNGSQGYLLASNPILNPLLYDPDKKTFEIQAPSTIPRVYHSTANLLPDGRVLVAGSNTRYTYQYTGPFPTELRVETFSPAYLDATNDWLRPRIAKNPFTITYGMPFSVDVAIPGKLVGNIQLTLLSSPFTTHSFSQGQRQLKLPVAASVLSYANTYYVASTAPPSSVVAPPSYYMLFALHNGIPSQAVWVLVTS